MNRFRKIPRILPLLAGLAIFGMVRAPWEDGLRERLVSSQLLLPPPARDAVGQMSQSALMGTLGGLRSLVSTYLALQAFDQFSSKGWDDLRRTYAVITSLEPTDENHWRDVVWHLGINATADMEYSDKLPEFERKRRFQEYALQAIALAEEGMEQNPDSAIIPMQLAEVYREKLRDNCATARTYGIAMTKPGAPGYARRFHGYFLAHCEGSEKEAYEHLVGLYHENPQHRTPTLIIEIKRLEDLLDVPAVRRIPDALPSGAGPARKTPPGDSLPGGIVVP